ncbi:MAG TPA: RNB domain-containing ribonuclease [Polyangiaceae bacterium]|nr:RNB domain-containing ribonuclease [Polyangiaceae bacterium]
MNIESNSGRASAFEAPCLTVVEGGPSGLALRAPLVAAAGRGGDALPPAPAGLEAGDVVAIDLADPARFERFARGGTARADVLLAALAVGANPFFPARVRREVAAIDLDRSLAAAGLEDLTALPFVTIDAATSRDLDQALHIEVGGGPGVAYVVRYALADAAHFVPKDSALFEEALVRGASVYLPGFSVPMLPRELSEGVVSLNPDGPRRALVFEVRVDRDGKILSTEVRRAKVRSRAKLAFPDVQALYDTGGGALARVEFSASLEALRGVGEVLMREAASRDVARYRRGETELQLTGPDGAALTLVDSPRARVEMYNEQLSLLVNREGARMLLESPAPHVQPIYRVHPSPPEDRLASLQATLASVERVHGLGPAFHFDPAERPLAAFLAGLPTEGPEGRVADAVHRQAIVVNARSSFSSGVGEHHGVGAEAYARFSAPMREVVGIFVHHEMVELLAGAGGADDPLRERVVAAANHSKDTQRKANDLVGKLYFDALFGRDLALPLAERPRRRGTIMGFTSSKVHVSLDEPPLDVKLYVRDVGRARGGAWLVVADDGATLRDRADGALVARLGDEATVFTEGRDARQDRWILQLEGSSAPA